MHFMKGKSSKASAYVGLTKRTAKKRLEECMGLSLDDLNEFFQLQLADIKIEANGSYFNTFWRKSNERIINWTPMNQSKVFVEKMLTQLTKSNFSASSLALAFLYVLKTDDCSSSSQWLLEEIQTIINNVKAPFIEEFAVMFGLNAANVHNISKLNIKLDPQNVVCNELKLKVSTSSRNFDILFAVKWLKLNESFIRLKVYNPKDASGSYFVWRSFELDEVTEKSFKARFITRENFCSSYEKWELVLEKEDFSKSIWETLTEPIKLREAKQTAKQGQIKPWWSYDLNADK
jgi:hypothetical protein